MNAISARLSGFTAALFAIVVAIGGALAFDLPDSDAPDQKWIDYVNDDGHLIRNLVGGYMLVIAALLFLVFAVSMYRRFRDNASVDATWSMVMLISGITFSASLMIGAVLCVIVAGGQELGSSTPPTAETARWLPQTGFGVILLAGGLSAAMSVGILNALILQTKVLPAWIAYFGFLATLGLIAAALFLPMFIFVIWMLVLGIVLLMRSESQATATA